MLFHSLPAFSFISRLFVIFCLICFILHNNFVIPIIFIAFERTHTLRVASFWMMCNFMDWAPSWTGWPLTSIKMKPLPCGCHGKICRWIVTNQPFEMSYYRTELCATQPLDIRRFDYTLDFCYADTKFSFLS